jgi:pimeloyl-ACP methyl ester carboxylesterase
MEDVQMATQTTATNGYVQANGLKLHYLEWGLVTAEPIIMLHGLRGSARTWESVAQPLSEEYRPIALDQRGRGESDWATDSDYSRDAYVSDVEQLVEQLSLGRFILIGHSMGGANALHYSTKHPEQLRALVIEDMGPAATAASTGSARIGDELARTPSSFASWGEATTFMRGLRPTVAEDTLRSVVDSALKQTTDGRVTWRYDLEGIRRARQNAAASPVADQWPAVRALTCPTLVLRGGKSDILAAETAQSMSDANPCIRWVEIPGASHTVHDDNLSDYNRELGRFLRDLPHGQ